MHAMALVLVPLCGVAVRWQVERALGGNTLSWLYVFEWPAFAAIGIWLWWALLTLPDRRGRAHAAPSAPATGPSSATSRSAGPLATSPRRAEQAELLEARRAPIEWDHEQEPERLRRYNAYLAGLAAGRTSARRRR